MATGILKFVRQWHLQKKSLISSRRSRHKGKMGRGGILCLRRRPHRRSTSRCSSSRRRRSSPLRGGGYSYRDAAATPPPSQQSFYPRYQPSQSWQSKGQGAPKGKGKGKGGYGGRGNFSGRGKGNADWNYPNAYRAQWFNPRPPPPQQQQGKGKGQQQFSSQTPIQNPNAQGASPQSNTPAPH